jgi:putative FmdB family regulatory protein
MAKLQDSDQPMKGWKTRPAAGGGRRRLGRVPSEYMTMPLYEYRPSGNASCDYCRDGFEDWQRLSEAPLAACPACDAPVERVMSSFRVGTGNVLSSANLKAHGFTRLRKVDAGRYVKE